MSSDLFVHLQPHPIGKQSLLGKGVRTSTDSVLCSVAISAGRCLILPCPTVGACCGVVHTVGNSAN